MNALSSFLVGRRTYIVAALALAYLLWCQFQSLQPNESIITIFGFLGLGFLRSAVSRNGIDAIAIDPTSAGTGMGSDHESGSVPPTTPAAPRIMSRVGEWFRLVTSPPRAAQPTLAVAAILAGLLCVCALIAGCALQRPYIHERTETTNGVVQLRTMKATSVAIWPATAELAKGRLSAGKTLAIGVDGETTTAGATTNDVEVLKNLRGILGR